MLLKNAPQQARCGDRSIKLDHVHQWARADAAVDHLKKGAAEQHVHDCFGCKGMPVWAHLPYVDINNLFLVPIMHSLLLGVLKRFWSLMLCKQPGRDEAPRPYRMPASVRKVG